MSPNPLAKLIKPSMNSDMKQLKQYVSEYASAVDSLRVAGGGRGYTDVERAQAMQKLVNAAEKIKLFDLSGKEFEKGLQGFSSEQKRLLRLNYNEYLEIKNGQSSPQQLFKDLNINLPVPGPILDDAVLVKKLQKAVSSYNAAENTLRVGEFTTSYTDQMRKQDLQKLVNAAEEVKRLHSWIPKEQFEKAIAATIPEEDRKRMFNSYLSDMGKIASGEKNPKKLAADLRIELAIPAHTVPLTPPPNVVEPQADKPEESKKEGFFSRLKNKISDVASGFANYMKEHPVRGGLLIAGAVIGIGIIVAASVFTGGAAGAAAVGGFAALMGGGSAVVSGVLFGAAVSGSCAIALAYDVNKDMTAAKNTANLQARLNAGLTSPASAKPAVEEQPKPEPTQTHSWKCGTKCHEDRVHHLNNGNNEANIATTAESRESVHASRGPTAPSVDNLANETNNEEDREDDRETESPHM
ncbi:hypothetical protein J2N86_08675 [Legionella lytica]|uniref:Dot/Icm T4SS effector n=1 Tax=Legionella lytica TaxID=96232 RepID=A0ABY4Y5L2_9GAMM|nr:hypothetical protein [Legionella lytica]USQ12781.1 hypothetical protein J2N86_08675 [Legionella lytica]